MEIVLQSKTEIMTGVSKSININLLHVNYRHLILAQHISSTFLCVWNNDTVPIHHIQTFALYWKTGDIKRKIKFFIICLNWTTTILFHKTHLIFRITRAGLVWFVHVITRKSLWLNRDKISKKSDGHPSFLPHPQPTHATYQNPAANHWWSLLISVYWLRLLIHKINHLIWAKANIAELCC